MIPKLTIKSDGTAEGTVAVVAGRTIRLRKLMLYVNARTGTITLNFTENPEGYHG